jgi:hypothetical protein
MIVCLQTRMNEFVVARWWWLWLFSCLSSDQVLW